MNFTADQLFCNWRKFLHRKLQFKLFKASRLVFSLKF